MRALCGAIIAAGALIGLGLTAQGIGTRYQNFARWESAAETHHVRFLEMDTGLIFATVVLTLALLIGLGIAFIGLAYHHHRRHHEHLRSLGHGAGTAPPASAGAAGIRPS
jgi:hypothetical protein